MKHDLIMVEFPHTENGESFGTAGELLLSVCSDNDVPQGVGLTILCLMQLSGGRTETIISSSKFSSEVARMVSELRAQGADIHSEILDGTTDDSRR